MATTELPEHELYISELRDEGDSVHLRLLSDYFPREDRYGLAYNLQMHLATPAPGFISFLEGAKERKTYVYVSISDRTVSVSTEDGESLECAIVSATVVETDLNEAELKAHIDELRRWSDRDNAAIRDARSKLLTARSRVLQQIERVEAKAVSHADTTAGTLYRQQIEFLQRLLSELGP